MEQKDSLGAVKKADQLFGLLTFIETGWGKVTITGYEKVFSGVV
jgi:hypothetical protein